MATKVIKTPGQRLALEFAGASWESMSGIQHAQYETRAAKLGIQPITEEVADPPTDGELIQKAYRVTLGNSVRDGYWKEVAAEFLRLRAERDGEPLPVEEQRLAHWLREICRIVAEPQQAKMLADAINQHRGVRPVPQVTAEMLEQVLRRETLGGAAESLNAALAKAATVQPVTQIKVAAYATLNGHLHTFECAEDMKAFTRANHHFCQANYVDGHEHHPKQKGTVTT